MKNGLNLQPITFWYLTNGQKITELRNYAKHCSEAVGAQRLHAAQPALDQTTPGNSRHTDVTLPARHVLLVNTVSNTDSFFS